MKINKYTIVLIFTTIISTTISISGYCDDGFTQKDREMLIRLNVKVEAMDKRFDQVDKRFDQVDKRFDQVDKRFDQVNKRIDQVDKRIDQVDKRIDQVGKRIDQVDKRIDQVGKRIDQVDKRFDQLLTIFMGMFGALVAVAIATIGFALWDRKTMIRPFEDKMGIVEELVGKNKHRLHQLLDALRELAKEDSKLAAVLRSFALL